MVDRVKYFGPLEWFADHAENKRIREICKELKDYILAERERSLVEWNQKGEALVKRLLDQGLSANKAQDVDPLIVEITDYLKQLEPRKHLWERELDSSWINEARTLQRFLLSVQDAFLKKGRFAEQQNATNLYQTIQGNLQASQDGAFIRIIPRSELLLNPDYALE